jgi:hypothetical protein
VAGFLAGRAEFGKERSGRKRFFLAKKKQKTLVY